MFTIKKPTTKDVPVEVIFLKWSSGPLEKGCTAKLKCGSCLKPIGVGMCAVAWIKDGGQEKSIRLCENCAVKAETTLGDNWDGI